MNKLDHQKHIVNILNNLYKANKVFHSYIFTGSKHCGRYEVALFLAGLLLKTDNPISHPNFHLIESEKTTISKEQVLQMNYEMHTSSIEGDCKVFVVEDAQKLGDAAQNSLLKIIENPEGKCYVIFLVEQPHQLLNTIVSRSQVVKCLPISIEKLYSKIADQYDDKQKLKYSMCLDSENFDHIYNDEIVEKYIDVVYDYLIEYFSKRKNVHLNYEICFNKISTRDEMLNLLDLLIVNTASMLNYKTKIEFELFDNRLINTLEKTTEEDLLRALNDFFECLIQINNNVNPSLAFDAMTNKRM